MIDKIKNIENFLLRWKFNRSQNKFFSKNLTVNNTHLSVVNKKSIITRLKESTKKYSWFYYFLIYLISSSYIDFVALIKRKKLIKNNEIVLNLWSGNKFVDKKVVNVDLFAYAGVDIVADLTDLPIADCSIDLVLNESNLEHVYSYEKVIKESYRILKDNWTVYFVVPFMFSFHSSPYDFFRFTHIALEKLFKDAWFYDIQIKPYSWPASSFVLIMTEFLSCLFSLGIFRLYEIFHIFFTLVLWPIKFLDIILNIFSFSKNSSSIFYLIAKK